MKRQANKRILMASLAAMLALAVLTALSIPDPLRLHIIANSDAPADQAVKLQVRNALLAQMESAMSQVQYKQQAVEVLKHNGALLQHTAEQTLKDAGYDYGVRLYIGVSEFPDRTYGEAFYPAGKYEALRVVLGDGNGKNWWCVMYPPLCLGTLKPTRTVKFKSAVASWLLKGRQAK